MSYANGKNYYEDQLDQLAPLSEENYYSLKITDQQGNSTKFMMVEAATIPIFIEWLEKLKSPA